jgi:hypothetical protein
MSILNIKLNYSMIKSIQDVKLEHAMPKTENQRFNVDYARLFPDEITALTQNKKQFSLEQHQSLYTGEEHGITGSAFSFTINYPRTPSALIANPDSLKFINEKKKDLGEIITIIPGLITPDFRSHGFTNARLSLEEIDPTTGEPTSLPMTTGLKRKNDLEPIRNQTILNNFKFSPAYLPNIDCLLFLNLNSTLT